MAYGTPHIVVEGYAEFQSTLRKQLGKLPAAIGEAHKEVGRFIIDKLPPGNPQAVGAGSGATIRPSATKRDVILRAGHGGRGQRKAQWGKREVQPFEPGRPYIVGTIEEHEDEIGGKFLDEVMKTLDPAFYRAVIGG